MSSNEGVCDSSTDKGVVVTLGGVQRRTGGLNTSDNSEVSRVAWFGQNFGVLWD